MRRFIITFFIAACNSGPPLSNATSLSCPTPGQLPFHLQSSGFQDPDNADITADNPRFKDEASDALGNPNATSANVYLDDTASPVTGLADYQGRKARTLENSGLTATAITGEFVSLWFYDSTSSQWTSLGRATTDDTGHYDIPATMEPPLGAPVYAMLEADGTCSKHYAQVLPPGSQVVVSDIDGTLTTSDAELITEIGDGTYQPAMMADANTLMQTWDAKKYPIVYLTARPHLYWSETRSWLDVDSFPPGTVITSNSLLSSDASTTAYKSLWLARMVNDFGWTVVAAYGNALTDIAAYQSVNIPDDHIFIIGPNGGAMGSTAIDNDDYASHISTFVDAQPDNP